MSLSGGLIFLISTLFCLQVPAQKHITEDTMPLDERGRYIHYEVVEGTAVPADSLYSRARAFLKARKLLTPDTESDRLLASGKFLLNKTTVVISRPAGEVTYNFVFEIKDGKYRFWLTDFVFIRYERDRYANFVPAQTKGIPLEINPDKLNAGSRTANVIATTELAAAFADDFKAFLLEGRKVKQLSKTKPVVSTKSW
ncbi:MAG TPA: DUF4468 domain-containing protein [Pedobacter sp.]